MVPPSRHTTGRRTTSLRAPATRSRRAARPRRRRLRWHTASRTPDGPPHQDRSPRSARSPQSEDLTAGMGLSRCAPPPPVIAHLQGFTGGTDHGTGLAQVPVSSVGRIEHFGVGALVARAIPISNRDERRHGPNPPLSLRWDRRYPGAGAPKRRCGDVRVRAAESRVSTEGCLPRCESGLSGKHGANDYLHQQDPHALAL